MMNWRNDFKVKGLVTVEFVILSFALLLILLGTFELARYFYSLQMLNDVTRRAARMAAVCHVQDINDIPVNEMITKSVPGGISDYTLTIEYLNQSGNVLGSLEDNIADIRFVRARLSNVNYNFIAILGDYSGTSVIPDFETTIPSESLGIIRPPESNPDLDRYTDCLPAE